MRILVWVSTNMDGNRAAANHSLQSESTSQGNVGGIVSRNWEDASGLLLEHYYTALSPTEISDNHAPAHLEAGEQLALDHSSGNDPSVDNASVGQRTRATGSIVGGSDSGGLAPGEYPYTRGVYQSGYVGRPWTIRQYAGFSTAEESNKFYKANLAAGQTGLSIAFDLPTHRGYDSDNPRVVGDVGTSGVAIDSVEDMKVLLNGIPLDQVSVSMTMSGAVLPIMAAFIVAGEESGVSRDLLTGTIQNDILKEFMVRNTFIYPPAPSMAIVNDVISFCVEQMPKFHPISISGYHLHEAGATPVQELAYAIANGIEYVNHATSAGLDVDEFAPHLSFFFAIGMDFFAEIAKLRAARWLWAIRMKSLGAKNQKSMQLRTHCQTSGVSLVAQDPSNNIIRTAYEALAAVLGGTQSLHTNGYDEALALPSDDAARIARNTQLILREETSIAQVVDPLGGSYYLEALTEKMFNAANELIDEVEAGGGMTRAVEDGFVRLKIAESSAFKQAKIDRGDQVVVGLNAFKADASNPPEIRRIDAGKIRETQVERLRLLRQNRDASQVADALRALTEAARQINTDVNEVKPQRKNLLELSINAVKARATIGEITVALEEVFGRYSPRSVVFPTTYGNVVGDELRFEAAIRQTQGLVAKIKRTPRILVAKIGQDGHDRGARLVASAFKDSGWEVIFGPMFTTPQEVAQVAIDEDVDVVGVSSMAGGHAVLVPQLCKALEESGAGDIAVIVGGVIPEQDRELMLDSGVKLIFGPGQNVSEAICDVINILGH